MILIVLKQADVMVLLSAVDHSTESVHLITFELSFLNFILNDVSTKTIQLLLAIKLPRFNEFVSCIVGSFVFLDWILIVDVYLCLLVNSLNCQWVQSLPSLSNFILKRWQIFFWISTENIFDLSSKFLEEDGFFDPPEVKLSFQQAFLSLVQLFLLQIPLFVVQKIKEEGKCLGVVVKEYFSILISIDLVGARESVRQETIFEVHQLRLREFHDLFISDVNIDCLLTGLAYSGYIRLSFQPVSLLISGFFQRKIYFFHELGLQLFQFLFLVLELLFRIDKALLLSFDICEHVHCFVDFSLDKSKLVFDVWNIVPEFLFEGFSMHLFHFLNLLLEIGSSYLVVRILVSAL